MATNWRNVVLIAQEPDGGFKTGDKKRITVAFPAHITRDQVLLYVTADKDSFPLTYDIFSAPADHPANAPLVLCEEKHMEEAVETPQKGVVSFGAEEEESGEGAFD